MQFRYLDLIRKCNPLVHCMTNIVVTNFSANGLLALGASPFMSTMAEEVEEIQQFSNALLINIGTIHPFDVDAMILAGQAANQNGVPVVLDPVGAGATAYRRATVRKILDKVNISAIRGNVSEVAFLADVAWQAKGVDAGNGEGDIAEIARIAAQKYQCCVAISGEIDYISDGKQVAKIYNGTHLFPKITGSGCLLGATVGAFLAVAKQGDEFNACLEACAGFAVAGELAAQGLNNQLGSFAVQFINQLADLTSEKINQLARIDHV
ncbi:hydroxyethylthiazole kinase [Lonepinella sp. BR2919]|uniref:hydroxyethylthiazole kinase n=1 Tax=unclassified Lonepinella TaxID=2642006 RepID=UPI003F6E0C9B